MASCGKQTNANSASSILRAIGREIDTPGCDCDWLMVTARKPTNRLEERELFCRDSCETRSRVSPPQFVSQWQSFVQIRMTPWDAPQACHQRKAINASD